MTCTKTCWFGVLLLSFLMPFTSEAAKAGKSRNQLIRVARARCYRGFAAQQRKLIQQRNRKFRIHDVALKSCVKNLKGKFLQFYRNVGKEVCRPFGGLKKVVFMTKTYDVNGKQLKILIPVLSCGNGKYFRLRPTAYPQFRKGQKACNDHFLTQWKKTVRWYNQKLESLKTKLKYCLILANRGKTIR